MHSITLGVLVWGVIGLSLVMMLFWSYEQFVGWIRYDEPEIEHGPETVQARVLTIGDDPLVVQKTVNTLVETISDIHVITEQEIDIQGASVHVVPSSFDCAATKKGRALEWGRQNIPCERSHVLYLDEDTQAVNFTGIPDADVVQFGEKPYATESWLAYLIEIFRMGFQTEIRAFSRFEVPLYAWGGGIAIRRELEDTITWNFESITEDTSFVWRAATEEEIDFRYVSTKFRNQAPPSLSALIQQRRRWYAGSIAEQHILPRKFYVLASFRNFSWSLSIVFPFLWLLNWLPSGLAVLPFQNLYIMIAGFVSLFLLCWSITGCVYMRESVPIAVLVCCLSPLLSVLNALGAMYGAISQPESFTVTEKTVTDDQAKIKQEAGKQNVTDTLSRTQDETD
jgi:hypothetical protein